MHLLNNPNLKKKIEEEKRKKELKNNPGQAADLNQSNPFSNNQFNDGGSRSNQERPVSH
jgi:hypothetical protein